MHEATFDLFGTDEQLSPRSILYNLPIEGQWTPQQESLLGYVHRLAHAHRVRVKDLLSKVVVPETDIRVGGYWLRFSENHSKTINGYGKYATEVSAALSKLTMVKGLAQGTFIHWQKLFDQKGGGVLHSKRRWCPACLDESRDAGHPITFPLLWSAYCVDHCPVHLSALVDCCARCGAEPKHVSEHLAIGLCDHCGHSLCRHSGRSKSINPVSAKAQFFVSAIGEMIALGNEAEALARPELLSTVLKAVAKVTSDGSIFKLATRLGVGKHTLAAWADLESKPRLDAFVDLCFRIGHSPVSLLSGRALGEELVMKAGPSPRARQLHRLSSAQLIAVESEIDEITKSESEFMDAKTLANKHNTSVSFLRYHLPRAYAALATHRQSVRKKLREAQSFEREEKAREVARSLFESDSYIPKARLHKALQQFGLSYSYTRDRVVARRELEKLRRQRFGQLHDLTNESLPD